VADLECALRDCSFDSKPRRSFRFHVVRVVDGHKVAACGDGFLIEDTIESAHGTLPSERCGRSGCRQAFAAGLAPSDGGEGT